MQSKASKKKIAIPTAECELSRKAEDTLSVLGKEAKEGIEALMRAFGYLLDETSRKD